MIVSHQTLEVFRAHPKGPNLDGSENDSIGRIWYPRKKKDTKLIRNKFKTLLETIQITIINVD